MKAPPAAPVSTVATAASASDTGPLAWQASAWQQLAEAAAAGRLGHALLLTGSAGVGKRLFAQRLARALLCQGTQAKGGSDPKPAKGVGDRGAEDRPGPSLSACGHCSSCRQMEQGAHPGFRCLSLDTTDSKQSIPVDAVREACAGLALTSAAATAKVLLIDRADDLNASGFNALLKTLEEPAARSYLLLTSEAPLDLPATIRSRCQQLRFPVPPLAQGLDYLDCHVPNSSPEARAQALADTLGAPVAAAALLMDEDTLHGHMQWKASLEGVLQGAVGPLDVALPSQRDEAVDYSRQVAMFAWRTERDGLAGGADPAPMLRVADAARDCLRRLDGNAQPRLALESLMIVCGNVRASSLRRAARSG